MSQSSYPYQDHYESFLKETFVCYFCKKEVQRGESIGRMGQKSESIGKSGCLYHPGYMIPCKGSDRDYYMSCCERNHLDIGCKPCDHHEEPHVEMYLDVPLFCIKKGWVKPLKCNRVETVEIHEEQKDEKPNKEKKLNIFASFYKIKRFEI